MKASPLRTIGPGTLKYSTGTLLVCPCDRSVIKVTNAVMMALGFNGMLFILCVEINIAANS